MSNILNDFFSHDNKHECIYCGKTDGAMETIHTDDDNINYYIHTDCRIKQDAEFAARDAARKEHDARVWGYQGPSINNDWSK